MNRILNIVLPSIIIIAITFIGMESKRILIGLFLLFPIIFIIQGIMYTNFKRHVIIGFTLSSIAFIIPINILYNMGSCINLLILYNILGITSYFVSNNIYRMRGDYKTNKKK